MKRISQRVCMLAAGIALAAGPVAWADGGGGDHRQGRFQEPHDNRGQKNKRAHRLAPKRQGQPKMMGRTLRLIIPRLSSEQREQVRKIRMKMRRQINTNQALLKNFRLDLREKLRQFPVDQDAVKAIFDQMAELRWKMLSSRLSALAQIQNLAGKKLWDQARDEARSGGMKKSG